MPGGAVGIVVDCERVCNLALVGKVHEFGGVVLLDEAMEETGDGSGLDMVGVWGADVGIVGV